MVQCNKFIKQMLLDNFNKTLHYKKKIIINKIKKNYKIINLIKRYNNK